MDEESKFYLPWYNLPIHTAPLPCQPQHYDVMPGCEMPQGRFIATSICCDAVWGQHLRVAGRTCSLGLARSLPEAP
jgi:hypothetical protein